MKVRLTRAALADIDCAAAWYEERESGLGQEFLNRVDEALDRIALAPFGYRKVFGENRRCSVERFPYGLWFKIVDDAIVVACLHAKRSPRLAKERAAGVREMPKRD